MFPRRKRIKELEGLILDNPSVGNYEELGDLYLDDGQFARARECFDRVIAKSDVDRSAAIAARCASWRWTISRPRPPISSRSSRAIPKYDYQRAAGLHAHALAGWAAATRPDALFADVTADVDALGDAVQLRVLPRGRGPRRRSARMGRAHPAQEGDDARLHPPAGTAVVSEGGGASQADSLTPRAVNPSSSSNFHEGCAMPPSANLSELAVFCLRLPEARGLGIRVFPSVRNSWYAGSEPLRTRNLTQ